MCIVRQTCWALRAAVAPHFFRHMVLNSAAPRKTDRLLELPGALTTAARYTRHLLVKFSPYDPALAARRTCRLIGSLLAVEQVKIWLFTPAKMYPLSFPPTLSAAFQRVNLNPSLPPSCFPEREPKLHRIDEPAPPTDADGHAEPIAALTTALQALPRLRDIHISVPRGHLLAHLPDLGRVEGLERLAIEVRIDNGEPRGSGSGDGRDPSQEGIDHPPHHFQDLEMLHASLGRSLANKPRLRKLELLAAVDLMIRELPPATDLLGKPSLAVLPSLRSLNLGGYGWDAPAASLLAAHYTGLRRLTVSNCVDYNCDELWPALRRAGIGLACLRAENKATSALMDYLASYVGLERLGTSPVAPRLNDFVTGQALVAELADALLPHAPTLCALDLTAPHSPAWSFGPLLADRLRGFRQLRKLWISALPAVMVSFLPLPQSPLLPAPATRHDRLRLRFLLLGEGGGQLTGSGRSRCWECYPRYRWYGVTAFPISVARGQASSPPPLPP